MGLGGIQPNQNLELGFNSLLNIILVALSPLHTTVLRLGKEGTLGHRVHALECFLQNVQSFPLIASDEMRPAVPSGRVSLSLDRNQFVLFFPLWHSIGRDRCHPGTIEVRLQ